MTLSSLSKELPSEEQLKYFAEILAQEPSDRSRTLMAAGLVEQSLFVALSARLADPGETIRKSWFEDANAPFATFSSKIMLGRALAIYGSKMEKNLVTIKNIRNVFAHRSTPIDFSHPTITEEALKLGTRKTHVDPMQTYMACCMALSGLLIDDSFKHGGKELEVSFP